MVGKRKINSHTFCIDPKKVVTAPRRPPNKADLISELKNLQKLHEALEEENKVNLNRIKVLEERVCELQNQNNLSDHKGSQRETDEML